jgi:cell division protein FtsL
MIRRSTILWLVLVAVLGFAMFKVKYRVMQLEDQLVQANRQIAADQHAVHVLKAEWSYLSQPSRLAELNQRFLGLAPISTKQLGQIETLPMRPAVVPPTVKPQAAEPLTAAAPPAAGHATARNAAPARPPHPAAIAAGTRLANARPRIPQ